MIKKISLWIGFIAILAISSGCAGPTRLQMDYGTSFHLSKFNQILNPEAEKNLEPVTGLNGVAAQQIMEMFWKGFETPTPPPVYFPSLITVGATGTK